MGCCESSRHDAAQPIAPLHASSLIALMSITFRTPGRRAFFATLVVAPIAAIGSLTAVALAQPVPGAGPVPSAAFRFGEEAARDLVTSRLWSGESTAVALSRDATRRDLVRLLRSVIRLPAGPLGTVWRDVAAADPDGSAAKHVVDRGWLTAPAGQVTLDAPLTGTVANRAWTLALGMHRAVARMGRFTDASGRRFILPPGFGTSITAREAGLRRNYPSSDDALERTDQQPIRLADLVLMAARGRAIRRGGIPLSVRALETFHIPVIDPVVVPLVQRALLLVGNPYVWGGEWPDVNSPLDPQASAGFDCSGFVWYVWRTGDRHAEASINVPDGRTTYTMNVGARGRKIPWQSATVSDLVFFGDRGVKTAEDQASHEGMSLGNKWIIHSSGGRGGVSITYLPKYWLGGLQNARSFRVSDTVLPAPDFPTTTTPAVPAPPAQEPSTPVAQPPAPPPVTHPNSVQPPAP